MSTIEVTLPVEHLEEIWDADCAQLLAMMENGVEIVRENMILSHIPRKGEQVTSELVMFTFHDRFTINGWRAYLMDGQILSGGIPAHRVKPGDRIGCYLTVVGG